MLRKGYSVGYFSGEFIINCRQTEKKPGGSEVLRFRPSILSVG